MLADKMLAFVWTYINNGTDAQLQEYKNKGTQPLECLNSEGNIVQIAGSRMCMYVVDASSAGKVYSGPPLFSRMDLEKQALRNENNSFASMALQSDFCESMKRSKKDTMSDGLCHKFVSSREYLVVCCCYEDPQKCAFVNDLALLNRTHYNEKSWSMMLANEVNSVIRMDKVEQNDGYFKWTKIDHLYAAPFTIDDDNDYTGWIGDTTKNGKSIVSYVTEGDFLEARKHLVHCAEGEFVAKGEGVGQGTSYTIWKHEMAEITEYCASVLAITYDGNDRSSTKRVTVKMSAGNKELCNHGHGCKLTKPKCYNDLINKQYVNATFVCCCNDEEVCNHKGYRVGPLERIVAGSSDNYICTDGAVSLMARTLLDVGEKKYLCTRAFTFGPTTTEFFYFDGVTHYSLNPIGKHTVMDLIEHPGDTSVRLQDTYGKNSATKGITIKKQCDSEFHKTAEISGKSLMLPICETYSLKANRNASGGMKYEFHYAGWMV
ncbi:unnamed protein product [Toxocara canis]|uniref:VWFD domain-containing protein n=1 Tax=Toxocara canis TaxID=6265 RepID=A0A183VD65_TOXCA|nr:unnamed protein product [Toxocara canis]